MSSIRSVFNNDPYKELAAAIVGCAVNDYRRFIKHKTKTIKNSSGESVDRESYLDYIEKWLNTDARMLISNNACDAIISQLTKERKQWQ